MLNLKAAVDILETTCMSRQIEKTPELSLLWRLAMLKHETTAGLMSEWEKILKDCAPPIGFSY